MDKIMTRRIIGVLVVFALVIILLPLMFNTNVQQSPLQTSEIKEPPFPDQQNTNNAQEAVVNNTMAQNTAQPQTPEQPATSAVTTQANASTTTQQPTAQPTTNAQVAQNSAAPQEAQKTVNAIKNAIATKAELASAVPSSDDLKVDVDPVLPQEETKVANNTQEQQPAGVKPIVTASQKLQNKSTHAQAAKQQTIAKNKPAANKLVAAPGENVAESDTKNTTHLIESKINNDQNQLSANPLDLSKMKKSAWVVQMGSFRDKTNAMRLTNSLRAKGYKAFTVETKSNGQTRVYVGPELKRGNAKTLATKINGDVNLQGIIVPYQPLAL